MEIAHGVNTQRRKPLSFNTFWRGFTADEFIRIRFLSAELAHQATWEAHLR
jgi:hypothetical protein